MQLLNVQDPRDNLQKARRKELERFARSHGVTDIDPRMPADLMRQILRQKGLVDINVPPRPLGQAQGSTPPAINPNAPANEVNAETDLMRQWQASGFEIPADASDTSPEEPSEDRLETISDYRKALKARGIKIARTDKLEDMKAKLNGHSSQGG